MLAELAALNSAYGIVKAAVGNGAEIHSIVSKVSKWAGLVEEAESKHRNERTKKNATGELEEALETWQTVRRIREQEEELRNMIIATTGDLNAWNDIVSIRTRLRKDKINKRNKADARRRQLQENIAIGTLIFIIMGVFVAILVLFLLFLGFI